MSAQCPDTVMMVEPNHFGFNEATAASNAFQNRLNLSNEEIRQRALQEFDAMVAKLQEVGVKILRFSSTVESSTDAVFPNNWVSFHNNRMVLYPMMAENRRGEREHETIEQLQQLLSINEVTDLSTHERENRFLEGTGSMVIDYENKVAYACQSPRTNIGLFNHLCEQLAYIPVSFNATDAGGQAIYHTNVLMGIGSGYAVICSDSIEDLLQRQMVLKRLEENHEIIEISFAQMAAYCGNVLELTNGNELFLAMSQQAHDAFTEQQLAAIKKYATPLPFAIPTIETIGGGSVRCMLAGVY